MSEIERMAALCMKDLDDEDLEEDDLDDEDLLVICLNLCCVCPLYWPQYSQMALCLLVVIVVKVL